MNGSATPTSVTFEQVSIIDLIRYGGSRFNEAGLTFGHSYDNALDEATQLVLHALHLPHDLSPVYGASRVTAAEQAKVLGLFQRRIDERVPAAYLTGEAWFAGLSFKSDRRALVPRSPIAELIPHSYEPWLGGREVERVLDLCTGSGSCEYSFGSASVSSLVTYGGLVTMRSDTWPCNWLNRSDLRSVTLSACRRALFSAASASASSLMSTPSTCQSGL